MKFIKYMLDVFVGRGCPQYVYGVSANTFFNKKGKKSPGHACGIKN